MNTETHKTRLMDGEFSSGFEALTQLARCREFSRELVDAINRGGAHAAVCAMRKHFFPSPTTVTKDTPLPPDHCLITVDHQSVFFLREIPFNLFDDLRIEYRKLEKKKAQGAARVLHASCALSKPPKVGNWLVHLMRLGGRWSPEVTIAKAVEYQNEFAPYGYRPLTDLETFEVCRNNPQLFWGYDVAAFGSYLLTSDLVRLASVLRFNQPGGGIIGRFEFCPYDVNWSENFVIFCTPILK